MKNILVPTDFSPYATHAIKVAANLAARAHSGIVLMNNVNTLVKWDALSPEQRQDYPETYGKSVESMSRLKETGSSLQDRGVSVDLVQTHGITYDEIVRHSRALHSSLIVMGAHGNEGSDRYFIGSNIQKVLREAECPVFMVKKETSEFKTLVFAVDLDEDSRSALDEVIPIARELGSAIHLLFVNLPMKFKDTQTATRKLDDLAGCYPEVAITKAIYNHVEPDAGILAYAESIDADWIAVATHAKRLFRQLSVGVTEALAYRSTMPVLSVNLSPHS